MACPSTSLYCTSLGKGTGKQAMCGSGDLSVTGNPSEGTLQREPFRGNPSDEFTVVIIEDHIHVLKQISKVIWWYYGQTATI